MVDFRPVRALRPAPGRAADVAAVPYDVVDTAEARSLAAHALDSLLWVTRPEIALPEGVSLYAPEAYAQAQRAFARLLDEGALVREARPGYFAYALTWQGRRQLGLVGVADAADYWADRIKKHEHTRPAKEDDRLRHIQAVQAHLGPVFLTFRARPDLAVLLAAASAGAPEVDFEVDGVRHQIWPVWEPARLAEIQAAFAGLDALYIADGHHRSAAAARLGRDAAEDDPRRRFLAVAFPHDVLQILPYNRVVCDRQGHSVEALLARLAEDFEVTPLEGAAAPERTLSYTLFTAGRWWRLALKAERHPDPNDPVARLDVSVLQDRVLGPILGVGDPRRDERIDFVGGIRGLAELERRAGAEGVAFALHPTGLEDLMDIADAGEVMPPKSTWFEPKLRSGLVISTF